MSFDFSDTHLQLEKTLEHIRTDVGTLRTGRASVQLLDPVTVEAYGSYMKLQEVASGSAPDPTLIVISPWDKSILANIERAIASADLDLNPIVEGNMIRIAIAPLTEEKRKEMVKRLHQKIEAGRVMMRSIRTDSKKDIEEQKGESGISEDDIETDLEELDKVMKSYMEKLDELSQTKEKELMTI